MGTSRHSLAKYDKPSISINTSSSYRSTSLDDIEKSQEDKTKSNDLGVRARMTYVATAELNESEKDDVTNQENVTPEQLKEYLADVFEATKNKKSPSKI